MQKEVMDKIRNLRNENEHFKDENKCFPKNGDLCLLQNV